MAAFRLFVFATAMAIPTFPLAHGGGLDAYGCHHNRKAGGYHCHRGPLAGQAFASKDAMLRELAKLERGPGKTSRK